MIENVYWSSCKVYLLPVIIYDIGIFLVDL